MRYTGNCLWTYLQSSSVGGMALLHDAMFQYLNPSSQLICRKWKTGILWLLCWEWLQLESHCWWPGVLYSLRNPSALRTVRTVREGRWEKWLLFHLKTGTTPLPVFLFLIPFFKLCILLSFSLAVSVCLWVLLNYLYFWCIGAQIGSL